jgi:cohesin loading factor subunit SCC2
VVRKRVIKLFKIFYATNGDITRRIDISTRLVLRMLDEDDTVKDLAVKTVEDLWFHVLSLSQPLQNLKSYPEANTANEKDALLRKVAVIMGVAANFKDRQSPLEDMLHRIMSDKSGDVTSLHARYAKICEVLIDGLVDASDLLGFVCPIHSLIFLLSKNSSIIIIHNRPS